MNARRRPGEKLGEGRQAEVFAWADGRVLRLMRDPRDRDRIEREAAAVAAASAAGAPVPAAHEQVTVDGRPGLVMERVDGPDLLTLVGRQPWRVRAVGLTLGRLHARLHDVAGPPGLPRLAEQARELIGFGDRLPDHLRRYALTVLDGLEGGQALCHGDFHPANVLRGPQGMRVIDWIGATVGDPHADVARTRLILSIGAPPPGASIVVRRLDRLGRGLMLAGYLAEYERHRRLDAELLDRWEVVRAAARVAFEQIDAEEPALLALLERRRRDC